jgi:hypothetical protein
MKEQKPSRIQRYLTAGDIFGQPIKLYFQGEPEYKTSTGGIFTILLTFLIAGITIYEMVILFKRVDLTVTSTTQYQVVPPTLDLTKSGFNFAVGHIDNAVTFNTSIYSIQAQYRVVSKTGNGAKISTNTPIPMRPCQLSDFIFPGTAKHVVKDLTSQFNTSGVSLQLCLNHTGFLIYGDQNQGNYSTITITVQPCQNGSNPYVTCASPDAITSYITNTPTPTMQLTLLNSVLIPTNYDKPVSYFLDDINWYLSAGQLSLYTDILLRQSQLHSEDDYFGVGDGSLIQNIEFAQDRKDKLYYITHPNTPYLEINLRSSNYQQITYRNYLTIAGVLSMIGGLWNVCYLIIGFFAVAVNKRKFFVEVAQTINAIDSDDVEPSEPIHSISSPTDKLSPIYIELEPMKGEEVIRSSKRKATSRDMDDVLRNVQKHCCYKIPKAAQSAYEEAISKAAKQMELLTMLTEVKLLKKKVKQLEYDKYPPKEPPRQINHQQQGNGGNSELNQLIVGEAHPFSSLEYRGGEVLTTVDRLTSEPNLNDKRSFSTVPLKIEDKYTKEKVVSKPA